MNAVGSGYQWSAARELSGLRAIAHSGPGPVTFSSTAIPSCWASLTTRSYGAQLFAGYEVGTYGFQYGPCGARRESGFGAIVDHFTVTRSCWTPSSRSVASVRSTVRDEE